MNICKRSCARVHAAEKHGERIFNMYPLRSSSARRVYFSAAAATAQTAKVVLYEKQAEVMDDTAFFAEEAAQGAATSRLGVPRPRGRPKKQSCKRESGNDQDLWCAGCRNNRVCRAGDSLITTNNT